MLTIFLDLVKYQIKERLIRWRDFSTVRGKSAWGIFYNKELSKIKRDTADALIKTVDELPVLNDQADKEALKKLVLDASNMDGTFGKALLDINTFIDLFYSCMENNKLLNIHKDNDPVHIFKYYMSWYFAAKCLIRVYPEDFKTKVIRYLTDSKKLTEEKHKLVLQSLSDCEEMTQNTSGNQRRLSVEKCIKDAANENITLCEKYGIKIPLPIMVALPVTPATIYAELTCDPGKLELYLSLALRDVKQLPKIYELTAETQNSHDVEETEIEEETQTETESCAM